MDKSKLKTGMLVELTGKREGVVMLNTDRGDIIYGNDISQSNYIKLDFINFEKDVVAVYDFPFDKSWAYFSKDSRNLLYGERSSLTTGHKLKLTVKYGVDYEETIFSQLHVLDRVTDIFLEYADIDEETIISETENEEGVVIQRTELTDLVEELHSAFENKKLEEKVIELLKKHQLFGLLKEYNEPFCEIGLNFKQQLKEVL